MRKWNLTIRKFFTYALIASLSIFTPKFVIADSYAPSFSSLFSNGLTSVFSDKVSGTFDQVANTTSEALKQVRKNASEVKSLAQDVFVGTKNTLVEAGKSSIDSARSITAAANSLNSVVNENVSRQVVTQSASVTSALNAGLEKVFGFAIDKTATVLTPFFIKKENAPTSIIVNNLKNNSSTSASTSSQTAASTVVSPSVKKTQVTTSSQNQNVISVNLSVSPLIQNILARLNQLENSPKSGTSTQNYIQNIYNTYSGSGGGSYTVPSDTSRSTSESINTALAPINQQITQLFNISGGSSSNIFASIVATSTATSTFVGPITSDDTITASAFYGDGSHLTGITAGASFSTSTTRGVFSNTATGLTYDNSTGITSLTSGYNIPTTASTTEWASKVGSQWTTSGANISYTAGNVGIGTTTPSSALSVVGDITSYGTLTSIGTAGKAAQLYLSDDVNGYGGVDVYTYGGSSTPHPYVNLVGSRGTESAVSSVVTGDDLGMLNFYGQADSGLELGAAVGAIASANFSGSNAPTDLYFIANKTERMRISAAGNVGIGTTTPGTTLSVAGAGSFTGNITSNGNVTASAFYGDGSNLTGITSFSTSTTRSVFSNTATGLTYDNSTGITSLTSGYNIPLTASTTEWANAVGSVASLNSTTSGLTSSVNILNASTSVLSASTTNLSVFYQTPSTRITAGTGLTWSGNTLNSTAVSSQWTTNESNIGYTTGNVGIGTTTPTEKFVISNSTSNYTGFNITHQSSGGGNYLFAITSGTHPQPGAFGFYDNTAGAYRMLIANTGNISIGANYTITPASKLAVYGNQSIGTTYATVAAPTNGLIIEGNVGIGTTSSSAKLAITGTAGTGDIFTIASSTNASLFKIGATGATYFNNDAGTTGMVLLSNGVGSAPTWVATSTLGISGGGGSLTGTTGQFAFFSGTNTAVGTSTLFLSNSNIGIGTTTPASALSVVGAGNFTSDLTTRGILNILGTGTSTITTNIELSGDIIPSADNTYRLGTPSRMWRDVYIGPGSLYVNGQKVLQTDVSNNVTITADSNQNLVLKSAGTGDLELNPSGTGQILLKGNLRLSAGKTITTSDASPIALTNGADLGFLRVASNTITPTNLNGGITIAATGTGGVYFTQGNVGIATTSPSFPLTVSGDINFTGALRANGDSGTTGMVLLSNGSSAPTWVATSSLGISGGGGSLSGGTNGYLARWTSGSTLSSGLFLDDGTYAGINATSSSYTFNVQGSAGVNPFNIASSSGASFFTVLANGNIGIGSTTPAGTLGVAGTGYFSGALTAQTITTTNGGGLNTINGALYAPSELRVGTGASGGCSTVACISSLGSSSVVLAVKGAASQTGDLTRWTNSAGTILSAINSAGSFVIGTSTAWAKLSIQQAFGSTTPLFDIASTTSAGFATSSLFMVGSNGNVGIGSSTPYAKLTVVGESAATFFTSSATTSTSTFAGGLDVGNGALTHNWATGLTNITNASLGATTFETDAGIITWIDMPVTLNAAQGTIESYSANIGGTSLWTVYSESSGSGGIQNGRIGVGTTTPNARFQVTGASGSSDNLFVISTSTNAQLLIFTSAGNLGIGTTTPSAKLAITGTAGTGDIFNIASSTNASLFKIGATGATYFNNDAGTTGMVLLSNGVGSSPTWIATSSLGITAALSGGTNGYLARWTSSSTLSSGLFLDNGTFAGVNATSSSYTFNLQGSSGVNPFNIASSTGTSLFAILQNGNVGIGSSTPYAKLTVAGESAATFFTASATTSTSTFAGGLNVGNGALTYDWASGLTNISNASLGAMTFESDSGMISWVDMPVTSASASGTVQSYSAQLDGSPALTVYGLSNGAGDVNTIRLGVGTTTPVSTFAVAGTINASNLVGGASLSADASGNIILTPSDERLKQDITPITSALDKVMQLQGVTFDWKDKERFGSSTEIGFIAQDVQKIVPEVIRQGPEYMSLNYANMVALVVEAVKELKTRVDTILGWFGSSGDRFNVKGMVCVDDVCVSKDQFKQMLINSGSVMVIPQGLITPPEPTVNPTPSVPPTPTEDPAPTGSETSGDTQGSGTTSDDSSSSSGDSTPPIDPAPIPEPIPEPAPTPEPAPEPAPAPDPTPMSDAPAQ